MRYISVCSGIEAATCAWHPLGWTPAAFSEIEKFPSSVLAHHYPNVPNLGDMTRFQEWPDDLAPNLIVGGTPCQSFSVAGLRKGLADPRGNLALTYLALADRYRSEWVVWENVPGVLSSGAGRDFGSFLGGLAELGYGFAYRVLDAQYFGVAQRRRRVFVVANARSWRRAAAVLFERESLSGHPAPRRETRKDVAPTISARTSGGGGLGTDFDLDGGLIPDTARCVTTGEGKRQDWETCTIIPATAHTLRADGFDASEDGTGRGTPQVPVAFSCKDHGADAGEIISQTLQAKNPRAVAFAIGSHAGCADGDQTNRSHAKGGPVGSNISEELAYSLRAGRLQSVANAMAVRRLTPVECERLQGFPDNYTDIGKPGSLHDLLHRKPTPDGPRYKALGNSMAVPVMAWIGRRIAAVAAQEELEQTA